MDKERERVRLNPSEEFWSSMSDWSGRIQREVQERPVKSCCPPFRVGFFSRRCPVAVMGFRVVLLSFLLVSLSCSRGAVITGVSERLPALLHSSVTSSQTNRLDLSCRTVLGVF